MSVFVHLHLFLIVFQAMSRSDGDATSFFVSVSNSWLIEAKKSDVSHLFNMPP